MNDKDYAMLKLAVAFIVGLVCGIGGMNSFVWHPLYCEARFGAARTAQDTINLLRKDRFCADELKSKP